MGGTGQLPTSSVQLDNTAKFLSQVGDYTYVLSQNSINGQEISADDYKNLSDISEYAKKLDDSLMKIQKGIYDGSISLYEENTGYNIAMASNRIMEDLENVEKSFEEYPSLIYDGPFSEHIENQQSEMINTAKEISKDDALKKAQAFLGKKAGREHVYYLHNARFAVMIPKSVTLAKEFANEILQQLKLVSYKYKNMEK